MAFGISWFIIPSIVSISRIKGLCDTPNSRTSHTRATPNLGGIAVFAGLIISTVIFAGTNFVFELKYIICGLFIVFFIGIKDDILVIDPMKKLAGQILAAVLIAVFADIRITDFYGLFGIHQLPYILSIVFTVFVFIVIINGFNLIDGIDGLASGIGILTSSVFGIWFWMTGNIAYGVFSFSFAGALSAFFYFNVFGKEKKIFLGDTGSLVTGLVLGVLTCRFLQLELIADGATVIQSAPAVAFGILIVPLFDTLRVFTLRISQGKSPFIADHQHTHHRLLQLGCTHLQATLILISANLFFIVLSFLLQGIGIIWLTCTMIGLAGLMSYVLMIYAKARTKESIDSEYFVVKVWKRINKNGRMIEKPQINKTLRSPSKIKTGLK